MDIGRVCVKTAGKDAGKTVVVVEKLDSHFVVIDGPIKRKRCNIFHLEPTTKLITLKDKAPHADVVKAFKQLGIEITEKKSKTSKGPRPKRQKRIKVRAPAENKKEKKAKKEEQKPKGKLAKKTKAALQKE